MSLAEVDDLHITINSLKTQSIRRHHEHRSLIKGNPFSENPQSTR